MNLFIHNISWKISDDQLRELFEKFGEIKSCKIITDRDTNRSKGFGFVEFFTDEAGNAAIEGMNGKDVEGRELHVSVAKPKAPKQQ